MANGWAGVQAAMAGKAWQELETGLAVGTRVSTFHLYTGNGTERGTAQTSPTPCDALPPAKPHFLKVRVHFFPVSHLSLGGPFSFNLVSPRPVLCSTGHTVARDCLLKLFSSFR